MIESVGILYGIQDLFDDLNLRTIDYQQVISGFDKIGTVKAKDVIETAKGLNWIDVSDTGFIIPTDIGKRAHLGTDRAIKLRLQLFQYISDFKPVWAALLTRGRKEAVISLPAEIRQCFNEAMLLEDLTDDVVGWRDRTSPIMREDRNSQLFATGRLGERQTIIFEKMRTGLDPVWKSFETNFAGYDVLSVHDISDSRRLKIEVKVSVRRFRDALINITEHEWITAKAAPDDYIFYIWLIDNFHFELFIVKTYDIIPHIPDNKGKGIWKTISIPVGALTHPSKSISLNEL